MFWTYGGWAYNPRNSNKYDTHIGAFCENSYTLTERGFIGTMGKLFVWKGYANSIAESAFNNFFFRNGGNFIPKC